METPETISIGKLAEALSKAQAKIKAPIKNRHVDFTPKNGGQRVKYSYADLADVIESCRVPLSENGLAVVHQLEAHESKGFGLLTTLMHSSGEKLTTWYPLPNPSGIRAQDFGSALTYARRYSLSSIVGIASDEDDDGAQAPPPEAPKKPSYPPKPQTFPQPNVPQRTSVSGVVNQMHKAPAPKPVSPPPRVMTPTHPSDPGYFDNVPEDFGGVPEYRHEDDLDAALDGPMLSLQEQLFKLVDDRGIPIDEVKRIIKQLCGGIQKKTDEMNDTELDSVIQYIKLTKK